MNNRCQSVLTQSIAITGRNKRIIMYDINKEQQGTKRIAVQEHFMPRICHLTSVGSVKANLDCLPRICPLTIQLFDTP